MNFIRFEYGVLLSRWYNSIWLIIQICQKLKTLYALIFSLYVHQVLDNMETICIAKALYNDDNSSI